MNHVTEYSIIHTGLFQEEDFHFEVEPGIRKYEHATVKMIQEAWQEAKLNPDLTLFNGKVISLLSVFMTANTYTGRNNLFLKVQETDYKSFYGTNVCNPTRLSKTELASALAVCAVVETNDGMVFVGKRSDKLAETSGLWHVPGGTFNEVTDPISLMRKELKEELNIIAYDIQFGICLGFGENLLMKKPEFLCHFHLKLSSKELSHKMYDAPDTNEHTEFVFVPMEELQVFTEIHPFAPIGKAAVQLYLEHIKLI